MPKWSMTTSTTVAGTSRRTSREDLDPIDALTEWYFDRNVNVPCPTRVQHDADWDTYLSDAVNAERRGRRHRPHGQVLRAAHAALPGAAQDDGRARNPLSADRDRARGPSDGVHPHPRRGLVERISRRPARVASCTNPFTAEEDRGT